MFMADIQVADNQEAQTFEFTQLYKKDGYGGKSTLKFTKTLELDLSNAPVLT